MKNISVTLFFILAMCAFCFAQSKLPEFDKAKQIKLLQSTREDVKKIFAGYEYDDEDYDSHEQYYSNKNAEIEVEFSAGDCAGEYSEEIWNVSEWAVTKVKISLQETIKVKDFNFDFSSFTKEIRSEELPEHYIYYNEISGIIFEIVEGEIQKIILYPPKSNIAFLCTNKKTSDILSTEKRLVDAILEDESCGYINQMPHVIKLILSAEEIIECNTAANNKACNKDNGKISIFTIAFDPENDPLVYDYKISGGEIIGRGVNVVWDLTGVPPGTYTITAGVDDGAGVVGQTITKTVVVRECSECSQDQKLNGKNLDFNFMCRNS